MEFNIIERNFLVMNKTILIALVFSTLLFAKVTKQIIMDTKDELLIQLNIDALTDSDLFPTRIMVGLPNENIPITNIQYMQKTTIPFDIKFGNFNKQFSWNNQQQIQNLETAILTIYPFDDTGTYFKSILIKLNFDRSNNQYRHPNKTEKILLENRIINWKTSKHWINKHNKNTKRAINNYPPGRWISFQLFEDRVAYIKGTQVSNIISNLSELDPRSFMLFMSSELGRSRTRQTDLDIPDNLVEVSIQIIGESDGLLDNNDKIIFYGRGPSGYDIQDSELIWKQNIYFNENKAWLFIPDDQNLRGKRILTDEPPNVIDISIDYGNAFLHIESDLINLDASGTLWLGNSILPGGSQALKVALDFPRTDVDINLNAALKGHSLTKTSIANHSVSIHHMNKNGNQIGNTMIWSGSGKRNISDPSADITPINGSNYFHFVNSSNDQNSAPYIDYFKIQYGRELNFSTNFGFISPVQNQNVRFVFSGNSTEEDILWNISNPGSPKNILISQNGYAEYAGSENTIDRFVFFKIGDLPETTDLMLESSFQLGKLRNTINKADYIIIGPEEYEISVKPLLELRSPAIYASIENIYNEFSAGNSDPIAIRTFIQWTQEYWQSPPPFAALLLGDGGYDYRNITGNSSIIVPTIQVQGTRSYASDDRLMTIYGNLPEIAHGRFPAKNEIEVKNFIEKIIAMETNPEFGTWRQTVTLIADDAARPEPNHGSIATGKSHTLNSEELSEMIPSFLYIDKLYMMEFPEVSDASAYGVIKPAATEALFNRLNTGTSIVSYIGHGSPYQLAQEKLLYLDRSDINNMNTGLKLPLWIVGTCSFGHFDDPLTESFAEELIRQPLNAAGMVISTTRAITVTGNERYTKDLFQNMFPNQTISTAPVGIILQSIKDGTNESEYFHLFGDPAMLLPMPTKSTNLINIIPDTLRTLNTANFSGQQEFIDGSGYGFISVLDAKRNIKRNYIINSEQESLSYTLPGATLFRGQFTFEGSEFAGQLRIPQDISYSSDPARLMIYLYDDYQDITGVLEGIPLSGGQATTDKNGPIITFETSSGLVLRSGDHFSIEETLVARLSDPIGINVTNETGHEIKVINLKNEISENITNKFYYDHNSITTGTIKINSLDDVKNIHIQIKAWDNANNPNTQEIFLSRLFETELKIYNAYNFPNPFYNSTQFAFEITSDAEVKLDIYSIGGRKIKSFESISMQTGYHYIDWDGNDAFGGHLSNGVYLYRLKAIGAKNTEIFIGRCTKFK
ncbi:MAG: hypothetical protein CMG74_02835 [Candidatus Marinimicrobia bacterium]|nr:hypothetical protein [Candidatus Neomarinimicrobiota bacterium]